MTEALLRRDVLDRGYVELIDYMGTDDAPVDAARVSFGKRAEQYTPEQNDRLAEYLQDHNHETPFEMITFKFRVKAPVLVWWHWVRHRIASYNFISGRYVPFDETEVYRVDEDKWRLQSKSNKQGSSGEFLPEVANRDDPDSWAPNNGVAIDRAVTKLYEQAFKLYQSMLDTGIAREQARLVLPFGACYYEAIVQMNARSLANFLHLRRGGDAQSEIRDYADALHSIVHETHPRTFPA